MKIFYFLVLMSFALIAHSQPPQEVEGVMGIKFNIPRKEVLKAMQDKGGIHNTTESSIEYDMFNNITFAEWKTSSVVCYFDKDRFTKCFINIKILDDSKKLELYDKITSDIAYKYEGSGYIKGRELQFGKYKEREWIFSNSRITVWQSIISSVEITYENSTIKMLNNLIEKEKALKDYK